jgi:hypothetical protein
MAAGQRNEYRWAISTVVLVTVLVALGLAIAKMLTIQTSESAHIPDGSMSSFTYSSVPPTSGPHYETVADWVVYSEPLRYEQVLHNLEHGGIAIYYQCEQECPAVVQQLEAIVTPYLAAGRKVLMLPNVPTWREMYNQPWHQDMQARIAVIAWHHIEKYNEVEPLAIQNFIEQYEGIDNHPPNE